MSPPERQHAYIGLGSNLDRPLDQIRRALARLAALPESRLAACSAPWRSAPVGPVRQPDFINAVCRLDTALEPEALMDSLLAIERAQGRVRAQPGGPRTLDLDLLLYGARRCRRPGLTLPHPRLHERAFVLYPLREIAPQLRIPGRGPLEQLLPACSGQRIERLTGEPPGLAAMEDMS